MMDCPFPWSDGHNDWIYATDRSINTAPVPWGINFFGVLYRFETLLTTQQSFNINGTFQLDFFDFSMSEPNYDSFNLSHLVIFYSEQKINSLLVNCDAVNLFGIIDCSCFVQVKWFCRSYRNIILDIMHSTMFYTSCHRSGFYTEPFGLLMT